MEKYYITEQTFEKIFVYLSGKKGLYCKNREKTRKFLEAIYFIMRTGIQWMELPRYYGEYKSIHRRFIYWAKKGIWNEILAYFSKDYDGESFMIDGSIVRAHACASGYKKGQQEEQALGRSKGGFSTKIYALVDALGLPLKFILTPGQSSEIKQAPEFIKGIKDANILGDKAFDCDGLLTQIISQNCTPVIPPRSNRKVQRNVDYHLYKERHLIECFFSKIKQFRRIFSRFDKLADAYMGFLAFVSSIIWLR
ncbi:MAG: IS5 family transposase [Alphaproteobacteria bacterium 41-28]|nr:MAG: IS5 family transposase [Alphaproteobacteria bacterium 41-28]